MKFSIITPTLQRQSLRDACASLDTQSFLDWEHLVQVDCAEFDARMMFSLASPRRRFFQCSEPHQNGGNSCRHLAWEKAKGDYCIYLDDDNYLADEDILKDIAEALEGAGNPKWAIFPITRLTMPFYSDPPRSCHIDTLNMVLRHDHAEWPVTTAYGTDGILADDLVARCVPYAAFPDFRPIGVIPKLSFCK